MDSPLLDREVFDVEFSDLHLAHTAVKHKPPRPEFAKAFQVKVWTGPAWVQEERQGGTQKLDGFFASFRREVGRRPFNTAGPSLQTAANMEQHLHERVRCFQFAYWLSGSDLLRHIKLSQVHKDGDPVLPIWKRERCVLKIHLIGVKSLEDSFPIYLKLETVKLRNFLPVLQVIRNYFIRHVDIYFDCRNNSTSLCFGFHLKGLA